MDEGRVLLPETLRLLSPGRRLRDGLASCVGGESRRALRIVAPRVKPTT
jgi:hypothetical protein